MINEHASNLRCISAQAHEWGDQRCADKLRQAANELDRLTRERDHLLEIREQLVGQRNWASQQIDRLTRERDEARAELKRMTPPPRKIQACFVCGGPLPAGVSGVHPACDEAYR